MHDSGNYSNDYIYFGLQPDEDGNGGAKELIDMIVPVVTKIVNVSISYDELANASESNVILDNFF